MEYLITNDNINLLVESQRRNICEEIVDQLKAKRLSLNMSQQDIANITGIQRPNIARLEGCTTTPTIDILVKYAAAVGCKINISLIEQEDQRSGRNKETVIDKNYISSGDYRRKFDSITTSKNINRLVYQKAKEMLLHRSGSEFEDMYWIDMDNESVLCSKLDETNIQEVRHTKAIEKKLNSCNSILAIHTHPHSMPPSVDDFNSFFKSGYKTALVICHDGTVYRYGSRKEISEELMILYINKYYLQTKGEKKAQLKALDMFVATGDIYYEEIM